MQLVKFNPFRDLLEVDKSISQMLEQGWSFAPTFTEMSTVDMYEEDGKLHVEVCLPNFKKEEISVAADKAGLEISAERKERKETKATKKRHYYLRESGRSYWRRVSLPENADAKRASAQFSKGILTVTMPLAKQPAAKKIAVAAGKK